MKNADNELLKNTYCVSNVKILIKIVNTLARFKYSP